jgi:hypothetical protein
LASNSQIGKLSNSVVEPGHTGTRYRLTFVALKLAHSHTIALAHAYTLVFSRSHARKPSTQVADEISHDLGGADNAITTLEFAKNLPKMAVQVGLGRIVASEIEVLNLFVNLV